MITDAGRVDRGGDETKGRGTKMTASIIPQLSRETAECLLHTMTSTCRQQLGRMRMAKTDGERKKAEACFTLLNEERNQLIAIHGLQKLAPAL